MNDGKQSQSGFFNPSNSIVEGGCIKLPDLSTKPRPPHFCGTPEMIQRIEKLKQQGNGPFDRSTQHPNNMRK